MSSMFTAGIGAKSEAGACWMDSALALPLRDGCTVSTLLLEWVTPSASVHGSSITLMRARLPIKRSVSKRMADWGSQHQMTPGCP